jgi:topoisomerase-4 subunit A
MTDQLIFDIAPPAEPEGDDALNLATYAQRAYLEYALSVVKGRALPDVCDGQKPVQRRILYAMSRMGLGFGGPNGNTGAKPVKSARIVGDVLGRFHPHGDSSVYDAAVRMAQDFSQRYPLIDGHGNFGSRDGDGAAAMRYTEARLAKITGLLLDEIDEGTVDFIPNYDGSTQEPSQLPARLPFNLLNGASGIAVGLATEIPSHNLREVADACIALIKSPQLSESDLFALIPAARRTSPTLTAAGAARSNAGRAGRLKTWRAASGAWC